MALIKQQFNTAVSADERSHDRDCQSLVEQLDHTDAMVRRWAARDLAECDNVADSLVKRLAIEPDISVREIIFSSLASIGDETAIIGLVDCLRSEDSALRNEAIEILKQLPDKVAPIMQGLISDPDPDVRIFTVNILESLRHPNVESWLIEVILHDNNVNVCATALDLLVEVGSNAAKQSLMAVMERFPNEPYLQFTIALALKRITQEHS